MKLNAEQRILRLESTLYVLFSKLPTFIKNALPLEVHQIMEMIGNELLDTPNDQKS